MNLLQKIRALLPGSTTPETVAHSTWAAAVALSRSLNRTGMNRTGVFLKRQIWIWPIVATLLLSLLAFCVRAGIESTMKSNLQSQLQTLLNVEVAMLQNWLRVQIANCTALANNLAIRDAAYKLLEADEVSLTELTPEKVLETQRQLRGLVTPTLSAHDYVDFFIADKNKKIVAASVAELIGQDSVPEFDRFLSKSLQGTATICSPFLSVVPLRDSSGRVMSGVPTMFACAPIRNIRLEVVGVLALRLRPEQEFTRILQLGHNGHTGETYAFDRAGVMISNGRNDEQLILLGILPDQPTIRSLLNVQLRDPQVDLTRGIRPNVRRSALPLTRMANAALSGRAGVDVDGYRDYRGVPVVGAWKWLGDYDIGVATEIAVAEAYQPLIILHWTFWALYVLLGLSSIAIFIFTIIVARLRKDAQKASIEARQLGQYTLDEKIGSGGMGVVYKGHHCMLRRPTAIKLLDVDKVNESSIQRFEREVQITCQLNHPNTVAIYDYGRTPEGVFYYAMEYLDGINLQSIIEKYGPLTEGRVIRILLQLCGSLYEAHSLGLVHRDIKPANLMLNRRGGESDVLKVLDFGLVKAVDENKQSHLTSAGSLTGTPLYMAPEAFQAPETVDARSDLYAVGAVGYYLLTGVPVFEAKGLIELCQQHIDAIPVPPSLRIGKTISYELEDALMACLEKQRSRRPHSARDLAQMLARCPSANQWTAEDADHWWARHERYFTPTPTHSAPTTTTARQPLTDLERTLVSHLSET